jgi:putative aldouronate transport system substrate-binding protein
MRTRIVLCLAVALAVASTAAFAEGSKDAAAGPAKGFNATGLPIVKDKTTLRVFMTQFPEQTVPFNNMKIVQEVEKATNVSVDWLLAPSQDYQTKVNLMFASNDLPDVFLEGLTVPQAFVYAGQGAVRPIDDLIDKYTVNIKKMIETTPGLKEVVTSPDGRIYNLFGFADAHHQDFGNMLYVNREWLAAVGLKVPTTTDEFTQVLRAFKGKDLNKNGKADEIPFSYLFYAKNANWADLNFFGSFGLQMDNNAQFFAVDSGKVVFEPALDGFKKTIQYLNGLYAEGLIDQEAYVQDRSQLQAKGQRQPPVLGVYVSWFASNVGGPNAALYDIIGPLKGPDGSRFSNWHPRAMMNGGPGVVTKKCAIPEVAIRWLDTIYEPETNFQLGYGAIGVGTEKGADGVWKILPPPQGISAETLRMTSSPHHIAKTSTGRIKVDLPAHFVSKNKAKDDLFMPNAPIKRALPVFYLPKADQEAFDALYADIKTYTEQKWAEWVMKGTADKEWDAYLKQLGTMGLQKILDIQQKGYDNLIKLKK